MSNVFQRSFDGSTIRYAQFPQFLVGMLPDMSESELKLYIFLLAEAQRLTYVELSLTAKEIGKVTGLSEDRLARAKKELARRGLILTSTDVKSRKSVFTLCYPPGVPLPDIREQIKLKELAGAVKEAKPKKTKSYTRNVFQLTANEYRNYFQARLGITLPVTDGWVSACCPFHEDANASLGILLSTGNWVCHKPDCPSRSSESGSKGILNFELLISGKQRTADNVHEAVVMIAHCADAGLASTLGPHWSIDRAYGLPQASYTYCDADGVVLYTVHRYSGKRFRTSRPIGDGKVIWNRDGVEPVLYRLPDVIAADVVICTEGERDSDNVASLRLTDCGGKPIAVTTCPNGCNWLPAYSASLAGKRVVILPDADSAGRAHAYKVLESVKPLAKDIRLVEWRVEDFSNGGKDVSDFLTNHTIGELVQKMGSDWIQCVGN